MLPRLRDRSVGTLERCLACEAGRFETLERCLACEAGRFETLERCLACEAGRSGPWSWVGVTYGATGSMKPALGQGRYRLAALPKLPFTDQEFDLCLCSHLLFLYSG